MLAKCLSSSDVNQGNLNASLSTIANQRHPRRESPPPKCKGNETVLVFPFQVSNAELYHASKGMNEAHGKLSLDDDTIFQDPDVIPTSQAENPKRRVHTVTIYGKDYDRLVRNEFLNDTLIDFWLQW